MAQGGGPCGRGGLLPAGAQGHLRGHGRSGRCQPALGCGDAVRGVVDPGAARKGRRHSLPGRVDGGYAGRIEYRGVRAHHPRPLDAAPPDRRRQRHRRRCLAARRAIKRRGARPCRAGDLRDRREPDQGTACRSESAQWPTWWRTSSISCPSPPAPSRASPRGSTTWIARRRAFNRRIWSSSQRGRRWARPRCWSTWPSMR